MSLILDALKKLERDKDAREPGVLVVGSVPWGARTRSRRPLAVALAGMGLVALLAFALWPRDRSARPAAAPSPSASPSALAQTPPTSAAPPVATPATAPAASPPAARRPSVPSSAATAEVPSAEPGRAQDDTPPSSPPPAAAGAPTTDDLRLNAISQRDGRPLALINDRLVFEGDSFDGVKVLRIGEAEVEVEVRGKRRVLRF